MGFERFTDSELIAGVPLEKKLTDLWVEIVLVETTLVQEGVVSQEDLDDRRPAVRALLDQMLAEGKDELRAECEKRGGGVALMAKLLGGHRDPLD